MHSITFLDDRYPVKTLVSEKEDWRSRSGWRNDDSRKTVLQAYLQTHLKRVVYARETHSGSVISVSDNDVSGRLETVSEAFHIGPSGGYDAVLTASRGILLCIWTADCFPLFLYDTANHAAAIAHCGWRGICSGIVENTLNAMRRRFGTDPRQIAAAFGPGICGNCYEVTGEMPALFAQRFPAQTLETLFRPLDAGKYLLDLRKAIITELIGAGAEPSNICDTGPCSYESGAYASFRRDGRSIPDRQTLSGIVLL